MALRTNADRDTRGARSTVTSGLNPRINKEEGASVKSFRHCGEDE
jgi:hypothetical protein